MNVCSKYLGKRSTVSLWGAVLQQSHSSVWHSRSSFYPTLWKVTPTTTRLFANKSGRKLSSKQRRKRESERQKAFNYNQQKRRERGRMKRLHPAAKMKRILSAVDFWFSKRNLEEDLFFNKELQLFGGHVRVLTLHSFPKLVDWTTPELIVDTLTSEAAKPKYKVVYNQALVEGAFRNAQRHMLRQEISEEIESQDMELEQRELLAEDELMDYDDFMDSDDALMDDDDFMAWEDDTAIMVHRPLKPTHAEKLQQQMQTNWYRHIKIDPETDALQDEALPHPVVDDGSNLIQYALVRHKSATSAPQQRPITVIDDVKKEKPKKPKKPNLPKYKSNRNVHVIKNEKQLLSFCSMLRESLKSSECSAIGFDAEYCTLDMDIRNNLPAMVQLASPQPDGPVGLVWLDKFPNHGKDMVMHQHSEPAYQSFLSILGDTDILKVGTSVSQDARHLAAWWGITDPAYIHYFFSGLKDLEFELTLQDDDGDDDDDVHREPGLQGLCASVLSKDLPKLKEKDKKQKKQARKSGKRVPTSHWRRDDLTKEMKEYASDDASAAIDIWIELLKQNAIQQ